MNVPSGETFGIPWILLKPGMPTIPRSSRSSLLLAGMYPPSTRPVILTVPPHGVRSGVTLRQLDLGRGDHGRVPACGQDRRRARVGGLDDPRRAGRQCRRPAAIGARGHRRGLGERVRAVVRGGQDRDRLASERAARRCSSAAPCSFTGRPKATLARVASLAADVPQLLCGFSCWRMVCLARSPRAVSGETATARRSRKSRWRAIRPATVGAGSAGV